jgi:hypothetical protein
MPAPSHVIMPACAQVIMPAHYWVNMSACNQVNKYAKKWVKKYMHRAVNQSMCKQTNMSAHGWVIRIAHDLDVTGSDHDQYNHVNQMIVPQKKTNAMIASAVLANQCIYCSADIVLLHQYSFINQFLRQPTIQYSGEHLQGHLSNLGLVDSSSTSFGTWARHIMLIIMKYRTCKIPRAFNQFNLLPTKFNLHFCVYS